MADEPQPHSEPNIQAIVDLIGPGGDLEKAEKKQQGGMTEVGKVMRRIEKDHRGNKAAVRAVRSLQKMDEDKLADYLRTFEPLLVELGFTLDAIDPDLADQAEQASREDTSRGAGVGTDHDDEGDKLGNGATELDAARGALAGGRSHLYGDGPQDGTKPAPDGPLDESAANEAVKTSKAKGKLGIVPPPVDNA